MRIVVTQLTRMHAPRICIAGVDPRVDRCIRPTTGPGHPLTRELLSEEGGPFALGALVDLGEVIPKPEPPESEDHIFRPDQVRVVGQLSADRYLELIRERSRTSLRAIFGDELVRHGRTYAVDKGCGAASLGTLRVRRKVDLKVDRYGKLRLRLPGKDASASLAVTDVRFVEADHKTIKTELVADVSARMQRGVGVILMLGLARAFQKSEDDCERHWLQVNGICMVDRPLAGLP
jgi:hypothetical protein